jgi:hypothetical protein
VTVSFAHSARIVPDQNCALESLNSPAHPLLAGPLDRDACLPPKASLVPRELEIKGGLSHAYPVDTQDRYR